MRAAHAEYVSNCSLKKQYAREEGDGSEWKR